MMQLCVVLAPVKTVCQAPVEMFYVASALLYFTITILICHKSSYSSLVENVNQIKNVDQATPTQKNNQVIVRGCKSVSNKPT